jgi:hypothetical protein
MSLLGPGKLGRDLEILCFSGKRHFVVSIQRGTDSLAFPRFTDLSLWDRQEKPSESIGGRADLVGQIGQCFPETTTLNP